MSGSVPLVHAGRTAGVLHDGTGEPADHSPRPFVHPVLTPGGRTVSDDRPSDHPWHHGLGIAVPIVAAVNQRYPVNLWGGPTFLRGEGYVQLPNNGTQSVRSVDGVGVRVRQQLTWHAADGADLLAEDRAWSVDTLRTGGATWFRTTVRSRWINTSGGELVFGSPTTAGRPDAGYGGFFLRLAPTFDGAEVIAPRADPALPAGPGAGVQQDDGTQRLAPGTAVEVAEAEARGTRGMWLGVRSEGASVLMVAGRGNPGGPTPWFVRAGTTPMLCAAPFFHEEVRLGPAGELEWTWSLLAADGRVPTAVFGEAARVPPDPRACPSA